MTKQVVHSFLKVLQVDSVHALGEVIVVIISQSQDSKALPSQQTSPILQKATSNSEKVYDPRKRSISLGKARNKGSSPQKNLRICFFHVNGSKEEK